MIPNEVIIIMTSKNSKSGKNSKREKQSGKSGGKRERVSVSRKIRNSKDSEKEK
ncbi:hypothetical protein LCGC14_3046100 [marine sediment metagenome]|uniref:Uncharacterized protein n=1 Tax=marine sediment metagenome TaxID=412755 RepID=A0A0F8WN19_9ZZZZ